MQNQRKSDSCFCNKLGNVLLLLPPGSSVLGSQSMPGSSQQLLGLSFCDRVEQRVISVSIEQGELFAVSILHCTFDLVKSLIHTQLNINNKKSLSMNLCKLTM